MFRLEREMLKPTLQWLNCHTDVIANEFRTPWGVIDIVGVKFYRSKTEIRIKNGQLSPINSLKNISLLNNIPTSQSGNKITVNRLANKMRTNHSTIDVKKSITLLQKLKFITIDNRNRISRENVWEPIFSEIIAIELKLSRFTDVLSQAINNKELSTTSFIAFPEKKALSLSESQLNLIKSYQIGLLSITAKGVSKLITPKKAIESKNNISLLKNYAAERAWKPYLQTIKH